MQRVGDEPVVFAENQSWEASEQVFAEEGNYSLTYYPIHIENLLYRTIKHAQPKDD